MSHNQFLSKSRYLSGVKCSKLIWYICNAKDKMPEWPQQTKDTFNYGHLVGDKAKELYPNGVESTQGLSFSDHIQESKDMLEQRVPIFEGGYIYDNCYSRVDVIEPVADGKWDLIEVKCNSHVHETNVRDVAWQSFCLKNAGVELNRCFVMHVKPHTLVNKNTWANTVFQKVDVTDRLATYHVEIEKNVAQIREACRMPEAPQVIPGEHCNKPYPCIMKCMCKNNSNNL